MNFSKNNYLSKKNAVLFFSTILLSALLLSSQTNVNYLTTIFFADISATISSDTTEVCKDDGTANITFEGSGGQAPYTFIYELNGDKDSLKSDTNTNSKTITLPSSSVGSFKYELIEVKDNADNSKVISGQIETININAPPTVDFSFNNNDACSGETIQFTNNSSGIGNLEYSWDFGDGTNIKNAENPNHIFDTLGCGTENFNIKLTVTDENGCSSSKTKEITVKQKPDIAFYDADFNSFDNCNNVSLSSEFKIKVDNSSSSLSCIDSYFIDWDDGTTTTSATFPIDHTYQNIGVYQMKITATGSNGCANEVSYEIKNVGSPAGSIASPGNTSNLCNDNSTLIFPITNFENNSDDTTYIIDFGDGSPNTEPYTQAQIEDNNKIEHKYLKGSCSEPGGEFIATLSIQNACKTVTSSINSIIILLPSEAKFESVEKSCVNKNIIFSNKSFIGDNPNCSKGATFKWDFGDGTIISNNNTTEITNQNHSYTEPGTYTVKLSVTSRCGTDEFEKEICIEPIITPTFTLNNDEGCIPFGVEATNTTDESDLCSESTYEWTVAYAADNCGNSLDWEFENGTDKNSENPKFLFKNPGKYTLTQKITTDCGTEITSKTIDVKKPPTVSINPINNFCQPGSINPTAIIENCTDNAAGISYNWKFPGGTPSSSTLENPENISYNTPGIYTITLEVTNECGTSNTAIQKFEVLEKPVLTNLITTQEICSNQSTIAVPLTSSNSNTTYLWTATTVPNNTNITGFITSGSTPEIPSQTISNTGNVPGNVVYTVTPSLNGCDGDPVEVLTVIINPTPIIVTQPVGSDICLDGAATTLEVVTQNGVGTPTYQWYSNMNNSTSGGTLITGATNRTYNPPTNNVGEIFYYVDISFQGGCANIQSDVVSVNTVAEPVAVAKNPSQ
ncbi:MAG: PKD domain-containing protein, partial [Polaribacter sp.]|nr:PKD domain-containing protein [Polaribacter sp.]